MCLLAIVTCAVLSSCGNEDPLQGSSNDENVPQSLEGTKLILYKSTGQQFIGITHQYPYVFLDTDVMVDYSERYAPTYQYYAYGNIGDYLLTATKMTYIPYYNSYTYGQFKFDIQLTFNSPDSGVYSGTQYNADGSSKSISGTFTLLYL